ncbi:MAG: hypothetical protein H7245_19615 [Candidatus Saccharibacteria bacterium]|nr:hypothetical protein [Pseudorhodobacter sp.]
MAPTAKPLAIGAMAGAIRTRAMKNDNTQGKGALHGPRAAASDDPGFAAALTPAQIRSDQHNGSPAR